jgi:5'-3' exonuclease
MRVHLVDATYELFRAHFGAPEATSPAGAPVGATLGFMRSMLSLLREDGVTHVACAFDHVIESFRNSLFTGYKTSEGVPPELLAQFPLAERAARALGLVVWPMIEFEADDALATAAARAALRPDVEQVVICSPDKDLTQCVRGSRVVCFDRLRRRVYDEPAVVEKFGVPPSSIPDWLALVGDDADGYPGIPRWGARSAGTVLAHYHHLDAIPDDAAQWRVAVRGAAALAQSLRERRQDALLYRTLATARCDVPLAEDVPALAWSGAPRAELDAMCRELGAMDLGERVHRWRASG